MNTKQEQWQNVAQTKIEIAQAFHRIVRKHLGDVLKTIDHVNATSEHLCATHDYCDANMLMADAFMEVLGREADIAGEADSNLWNDAWAIAAKRGFSKEWDTAKSDATPRLRELAEEAAFIIERADMAKVKLDNGNVVDLICDNSGLMPTIEEIRDALRIGKFAERFAGACVPRGRQAAGLNIVVLDYGVELRDKDGNTVLTWRGTKDARWTGYDNAVRAVGDMLNGAPWKFTRAVLEHIGRGTK